MMRLSLARPGSALRVLCLGAHSDDLEIGCAGTVLSWLKSHKLHVTWVVLSAAGERADEARRSAAALLKGCASAELMLGGFDDGLFPAQVRELKAYFEQLKRCSAPDVVLTHRLEDRHQDHRTVAELTWQTFRQHLLLEYEIPKYEGDLGQPNLFVPLAPAIARRKLRHLMSHFGSQRSRAWFGPHTFESLMQLRGIECRSASGRAEAFHARKLSL